MKRTLKLYVIGMIGICLFSLNTFGTVPFQTPPRTTANDNQQSRTGASDRMRSDDFQDARLVLLELDEQLRLASAKLHKDALARKEQMGRYRSQLIAVEQEVQVQAAETQRLKERYDQLTRDLSSLADDADDAAERERTDGLLRQSQQSLDDAQSRLERLIALKARIDRQLRNLRTDHLRKLLEASASIPNESPSQLSPLERIILDSLPDEARVPKRSTDDAKPQPENRTESRGTQPTAPKRGGP